VKILGAEMLTAAARRNQFPPCASPEVAFLGRSNVGKSSLLNSLAQRRKLARTSNTPGKTRLIHWYEVRREESVVCFVDLPGYGYARVSKAERERWRTLIESYLEDRDSLVCAVLLQDVRRDPTEDEELLIAWLRERGIRVILVVTKSDKMKPMRRSARVAEIRAAVDVAPEDIIVTSAEKGWGIEELWRVIDTVAHVDDLAGSDE
jgi:GTP-binding protein